MKNKLIIGGILILSAIIIIVGMIDYKRYTDFLNLYESNQYSKILENTSSNSAAMLHNYGITAFDEFKNSDMSDPYLLQEANNFFSGSLQKGENTKTRYQYELTKDLLDLFTTPENQDDTQEGEEAQEGEESRESSENTDQGEGGEDQQSQSQSTNGRDSEYFLGEEEEIKPLSEREKQALQQSIEDLKSDQMRNQQYYGKQPQLTPFQEAFEDIFGGIDRGSKKDW